VKFFDKFLHVCKKYEDEARMRTPIANTIPVARPVMEKVFLKESVDVARHVSRIEDVQRSVADYSHSPYLGCCVCRGVLSN